MKSVAAPGLWRINVTVTRARGLALGLALVAAPQLWFFKGFVASQVVLASRRV